MTGLVIDTHVALWLFDELERLSSAARSALNRAMTVEEGAYLSTITLVEIIYLIEKGRLPRQALSRVVAAAADPAIGISFVPVTEGVARNVRRVPWRAVPDMPDRIIAATALTLGFPLVTRDEQIRRSEVPTVW